MNYVKAAVRTLSTEFHAEQVHLDSMFSRMRGAILAAETLDQVKKALYYGRPGGSSAPMAAFVKDNEQQFDRALKNIHPDRRTAEIILHAAIGLYTEAGELVEALYKCMKDGAPLDAVNLTEESGDSKWYLAILAFALGNAWDADEIININKLMRRFPDKFDGFHANNRDLDAERAVLEAGTGDKAVQRAKELYVKSIDFSPLKPAWGELSPAAQVYWLDVARYELAIETEADTEGTSSVDETVTNADLARQRIGEQTGMDAARKFFKGES